MLNLLNPQKKKELEGIYKKRRLISILAFTSGTLVAISILLLPSYIFAKIRYEQSVKTADQLKQQISFQKSKEKTLTSSEKSIISLLQNDKFSTFLPTDQIDALIKDKGARISISSITLLLDNKTVSIEGIASNRDGLIAYKQKLDQQGIWSKVELPISALGPSKNNQFTITLTNK